MRIHGYDVDTFPTALKVPHFLQVELGLPVIGELRAVILKQVGEENGRQSATAIFVCTEVSETFFTRACLFELIELLLSARTLGGKGSQSPGCRRSHPAHRSQLSRLNCQMERYLGSVSASQMRTIMEIRGIAGGVSVVSVAISTAPVELSKGTSGPGRRWGGSLCFDGADGLDHQAEYGQRTANRQDRTILAVDALTSSKSVVEPIAILLVSRSHENGLTLIHETWSECLCMGWKDGAVASRSATSNSEFGHGRLRDSHVRSSDVARRRNSIGL